MIYVFGMNTKLIAYPESNIHNHCKKVAPYPGADKGGAASFTIDNITIVCGGGFRDKHQKKCYQLKDGWIHIGDMKVPRRHFTITPVTRTKFVVYGENKFLTGQEQCRVQ